MKLTTNLAELFDKKLVGRGSGSFGSENLVHVWIVFGLCFACSFLGVLVSFVVFGTRITGTRAWGTAVVVSVVMLGISYGAKYSNAQARTVFTPVDVLQFVTQGVLWPSTWPALADLVGIEKVAPPAHSQLFHLLERFALASISFFT